MSTDYGALFVADNGNPFIVPDNNVFTLAQKIVVTSYSIFRQVVKTQVPDTAEVIVFGCGDSGKRDDTGGLSFLQAKKDGFWQIAFVTSNADDTPMTCSFYVFANIVLNPSKPGDYGLFCFDADGREVYNTNAKLLVTEKLYPNLPTSRPSAFPTIWIGKKVACLPDPFYLFLPDYNWDDFTNYLYFCTGTRAGAPYITCLQTNQWRNRIAERPTRSPKACLVIDCARYD